MSAAINRLYLAICALLLVSSGCTSGGYTQPVPSDWNCQEQTCTVTFVLQNTSTQTQEIEYAIAAFKRSGGKPGSKTTNVVGQLRSSVTLDANSTKQITTSLTVNSTPSYLAVSVR